MTNVDQDDGNEDRRTASPAPAPYSPPVEPVPDDLYVEAAPRRRRWWWLAVPAITLFSCLGGALLYAIGGGNAPDQASRAPAEPDAGVVVRTPEPSATGPAFYEVVYLVTSTSPGDKAGVEFTDEDRDIIRKGEVSLPWRHTFRFAGDKPPLVLIAQRKRGGGTGPVTCSITVSGKELTTSVQRGRTAAPQCSA
ncbi:hypothetical protein [Paractinoplanes maris]|uniref:hypothetical protein n=1 Tax=Paractinoplanes maris TaxID=1734446 RepID=UPI0020227FB4|nr:hypothetical protein [Actinoplanes maris]